jgi:isopentenyl diphosphate isomerase/L-lactate dehydrogenase-like FMN-dependent dehydrogenase
MNMGKSRVDSPHAVNIADMRRLAQEHLPKVVFDYIDGGADDEVTMRDNLRAFEEITFRPRNAVTFPERDLRTTVLGAEMSMPLLLGPCGFIRMVHPHGEVGSARAAGKAGVPYILSTMSGYRLEDVAAATSGPRWYQLYLVGGREVAEATLERARKAGYTALVITIDTGAAGNRERDTRNGSRELMMGKMLEQIPYLPQILSRPSWLTSFLLDGGRLTLPNIVLPGRGPMPLADAPAGLLRSVVTWEDLRWLRHAWPGPMVVKGVMTVEDARRAVDEGAHAIIVSNHGGRQLDGLPGSLRVLPKIAAAVGARTEVLMDGGIRRGSDVLKALCLGARAVILGRAYAYGLGAGGEAGVSRSLAILRADMERTLALLGCASAAALDGSYVDATAWATGKV